MSENARKILETFKDGVKFLCLSDLAKRAGFRNAADREFKSGFNYLVNRGIITLQQSGWRSEERGSKNHPKTVILNADLYEIVDSEFAIDAEALKQAFPNLKGNSQLALNDKKLSKRRIKKFQDCPDCKKKPLLLIMKMQIPICEKHWLELANTNIEW